MSEKSGPERLKACPQCGRAFSCYAGDCWCDLVPVPAAVLVPLRRAYRDCLCPECLRHFASESSAGGACFITPDRPMESDAAPQAQGPSTADTLECIRKNRCRPA
ncbi:MAG: cysteine-rich CWC family protein [Planctomycetia bacterium]|nr:cysteine-rich CWC family protein [Planctomycetia bacterium]